MDSVENLRSEGPARLVIAGTNSGVGKTTITAGIIRAFCQRGLTVQPFKTGPDYIDPTYHSLAAGRPCRNLDPWMLPPAALARSLAMGCRDAGLALIEGVMGLYDGYGYDNDEGSTARLAKLLDAPVVLIVDIASMARSAAALATGYVNFDPALRVAGFILNRAGSEAHGAGVARAIQAATGLPCFGWLLRSEALNIPERHLGLVPTAEPGRWESFIAAAATAISDAIDLDMLLAISGWKSEPREPWPAMHPTPAVVATAGIGLEAEAGVELASCAPRIAVARDEAFSFYYEDNLELLREAGAEVLYFSPLRDASLPAGASGLYLGGGFPEMYAAALAENAALRAGLRQAIEAGLPTYAECGGLMYLTQSITALDGREYPMVGILPGRSIMSGKLTMGYRLATVCNDGYLGPAGLELRGHEFHYSEWIERPVDLPPAYRIVARGGEQPRSEGYARGALVASYLHLHWLARPELARRFVSACRQKSERQDG